MGKGRPADARQKGAGEGAGSPVRGGARAGVGREMRFSSQEGGERVGWEERSGLKWCR